MDNNIGENIKEHAKKSFKFGVIGIVLFAIIFAIASLDTDFEDIWYMPLIIAPFAIAAQWTICLLVYGFGQLIVNTQKDLSDTYNLSSSQNPTKETALDRLKSTQIENSQSGKSVGTWRCLNCGKQNPKSTKECSSCGCMKPY